MDIYPNPLPIPIESMIPIIVELLLDYGMISQIWFSDKTKHTNFPYKLKIRIFIGFIIIKLVRFISFITIVIFITIFQFFN